MPVYTRSSRRIGSDISIPDGGVQANAYGNHAVCAKGGIHFKPNPTGLEFIGPATEYAGTASFLFYAVPIFQCNTILDANCKNLSMSRSTHFLPVFALAEGLGPGLTLIAPTMLLKISHVAITHYSKRQNQVRLSIFVRGYSSSCV
jgi:hypothetical protein